jgi:hypothetical protein
MAEFWHPTARTTSRDETDLNTVESLIQIQEFGNACVHRVYAMFSASDGNIKKFVI